MLEKRTPFYATATGRFPVQDEDWWTLIDAEDGTGAVEHRWKRPKADGLMFKDNGVRLCSVASFFRDEGSDTAKQRLRRLLEARASRGASS